MTPFWIGLLKRAMPVVIEAGTSMYKRRSAAKQAYESEPGTVDGQTEKLEALREAVIRVATEMESLSQKQADFERTVTRLRWASVAALVLSVLTLIIVFSRSL
jgi:hypothetical protein